MGYTAILFTNVNSLFKLLMKIDTSFEKTLFSFLWIQVYITCLFKMLLKSYLQEICSSVKIQVAILFYGSKESEIRAVVNLTL